MFKRKTQILVGLTTFYNEYLHVSVPALARLGRRFTLIIHNDNPDTRVSRRQIRRLGYRGKLHIINTTHNRGMLRARLAILDFVREHKIQSDWFIFIDDDDILVNLTLPDVSPNNFAIIQNMPVIRTRLVDVLRVMKNPDDCKSDNENIYMVRPHVGLAGTLVRLPAIMRMADILNRCSESVSDIDVSLSFRPPVDMMMWSALNIVSRHDNESASPIYMDTVNYIATDIDTAPTKYGMCLQPGRNPEQQIRRAIAKYDNVVRSALAAPVGHEPVE